jgi:hypothetical protein
MGLVILLVVVGGLLLAALVVTYAARHYVGSEAAKTCLALSLVPLMGSLWLLSETWQHDDEGTGIAILSTIFSVALSGFSFVGLWLAEPEPEPPAGGTGLSRSS